MKMRGSSKKKKTICLIGGGHSHVLVIKQLGISPLSDTDVTLISPDIYTPYSGMLPGLIAGHYTYEDSHIDLKRLCRWAGVQFVHSSVIQIDPELHKICCSQPSSIEYDLLSIDIGSQPAIENIQHADVFGCTIKPVKKFLFQWHQWLKINAETKLKKHIIVVGCGAAGVEVLLAMHYRLQNTTTINADFTLICADQKTILPTHNQAVQRYFLQQLEKMGVTRIQGASVTAIDSRQLQLNNGSTVNYDFTVWAIHAGAQSWPAASGLKCDRYGFIEVDQNLRSISHPEIYAVGDCAAFLPQAIPKAGVYAVRQGPILFKNIVATLKHQPLTPFKPQQRFLSLLTTGGHHAVASRGFLFFQGKWVWFWKNAIDQNFMRRFKL